MASQYIFVHDIEEYREFIKIPEGVDIFSGIREEKKFGSLNAPRKPWCFILLLFHSAF